jgi:hypothetical protein
MIPIPGFRSPEGSHFMNLAVFEKHMYQTEALADNPGVPEEPFHTARRSIGGDIEILGYPAEKKISHSTPDYVGLMTPLIEPGTDFPGIDIDAVSGDVMIAPLIHKGLDGSFSFTISKITGAHIFQ